MRLSKKRAPKVDDANTDRAIRQIYDDINEVIDAVNQAGDSASSTIAGKTGDSRVTKKGDNSMTFQIRTEHGWSEPAIENNKIVYNLIDSGDA